MDGDIVVRDRNRQPELYREGPYDAITAAQPLERLLTEPRSNGLDAFLRTRQIAASRVDPLDALGPVGLWSQVSPYLSRKERPQLVTGVSPCAGLVKRLRKTRRPLVDRVSDAPILSELLGPLHCVLI